MAMASSSQTTLVITRPLVRHRNLGHTPGMTPNGAENAAAWQGFFYVGVSWLYAEISREEDAHGGSGASLFHAGAVAAVAHGMGFCGRSDVEIIGIIIIGIWRINGYLLAN